MTSAIVGEPLPQVSAQEKTLGRAIYSGDVKVAGMLHAKLLRSPYSHAVIRSIDTSAAEALPGVKAVVTGADVPERAWGVAHKQQHVLARGLVRFAGEEVAAVVAVSEAVAQEALDLIVVEYEEAGALLDPEGALDGGAPKVHAEGNLADEINISRGDVEAGFAGADIVHEATYRTHSQYPGYMEPMATVAATDGTGKLTVWTSTQSVFLARQRLAEALDRPVSTIRVIQATVGGGFGAKIVEERSSVIAAFLATVVDRPVRVGLSRLDDIQSGCFSVPTRIHLKMGMMRDGRIVAKDVQVLADCGAYAGLAPEVMLVTAMRSDNMQRIENVRTKAQLVYTHTMPRGAFRGFGGTQMSFALNSHMAVMADMLGMDAIELHRKNAIRTGDVSVHGWNIGSCGLPECLDQVQAAIGWDEKRARPKGTGVLRRGVGMAAVMHVSGNRTMGNWDGSTVVLKVNEDGRAVILTAESDMGQGANTMLSQICAQELGIPLSHVTVQAPDTDSAPYCLGSIASRVTVNAGHAMLKAARQAQGQILEAAAEKLGCDADELSIVDGVVQSNKNGNLFAPLPEICRYHIFRRGGEGILVRATHDPQTVMMDKDHYGNIAPAYSFAAQAVEVEVDTETGQVRVVDTYLSDDCGKAINPLAVHGQSNGAAVQSIGWTLYEHLQFEDGRVMNGNLADYTMPTAESVPTIQSGIVESNDPNGPLGAKGASETAILPGAPAIANAVFDAIGVRITDLPITPEKILAGLAAKEESQHA
ncbi:CO or xanthine dehydrogenase, Mo-binding subunit [Salinihabitans flavidus]|uniref:CO or xanthine dehydrogenase, Mo-binding subunit n=1 Tax=Salinihabitans flavidus TaxID=569882 RepID=A0A1H8UMV4_9RHOB|nr:xanthine dehydrogenase family protein molybdopterin-binding subunit [Salinihabitans flavidus]SEP04337.1 CO or xanthine dehydrogenase, Mo-binding subunit [Salinihabitans flavidus]